MNDVSAETEKIQILCCNHGAYPFSAKAGHWCLCYWEGEGCALALKNVPEHVSLKTYIGEEPHSL